MAPPGSPADIALDLFSRCEDTRPEVSKSPSFTSNVRLRYTVQTTTPHQLTLRLRNDAPSHGITTTYHLAVHTLPLTRSDTFIIVAGDLGDDNPQQQILTHIAASLRQFLLDQGYPRSSLYYLLPDVYDTPILTDSLKTAITSWAGRKTGQGSMLTLYFIGSGSSDSFLLNRQYNQGITAELLNRWLNELEQQRPDIRINVVIDAPASGSFIIPPGSVSGARRVVITSAAADQPADTSALTTTMHDALFSEYFLAALRQQTSLSHAFLHSQHAVSTFDPTGQTPQIDDPTDSAEQRGFLFVHAADALPWPPHIADLSPPIVGENGQGRIQAVVQVAEPGKATIEDVVATIFPPSREGGDFAPSRASEMLSPVCALRSEPLPTVTLALSDTTRHLYEGIYHGFTISGTYHIVIQARDSQQLLASPAAVAVAVSIEQNGEEEKSAVYLPLVLR